jgi:uncharacterized membrane protein YfcA
MLLLIAEIVLTIIAWQKGWRWIALIPMGVVLIIGFIIGGAIGASGGTVSDIPAGTILLDITAVIALIVLISVKPKSKKIKTYDESYKKATEQPTKITHTPDDSGM